MDKTNPPFTVGIWIVKSGKENDFIAAWGDFAKKTFDLNLGSPEVYLLQDLQQTRRFISCGPWESIQKIDAWRQLPEFKEFFIKAKQICEEITPMTMKPIIHLKQ
jgi:heme-degrading monooxygenase HmoA